MLKGTVVNNIGTTLTTIQTVPAGKVHILLSALIKNKLDATVGIQVKVVKSTGETIDLISSVPKSISYELKEWEGKLILEAGDMIKAISDTAASVDVMTNYTEEVNN